MFTCSNSFISRKIYFRTLTFLLPPQSSPVLPYNQPILQVQDLPGPSPNATQHLIPVLSESQTTRPLFLCCNIRIIVPGWLAGSVKHSNRNPWRITRWKFIGRWVCITGIQWGWLMMKRWSLLEIGLHCCSTFDYPAFTIRSNWSDHRRNLCYISSPKISTTNVE